MTGSFVLLGSVINTHFVFCFLLIDFFFLFPLVKQVVLFKRNHSMV